MGKETFPEFSVQTITFVEFYFFLNSFVLMCINVF